MAKTGRGHEECAHDPHLTRAVDARHAARSYEAGLEPCVNAVSTLATRPRCVRKTRFRSRARASERPRAIAHTRKAKPGCFRFEAEAEVSCRRRLLRATPRLGGTLVLRLRGRSRGHRSLAF